MKTSGNIRFYGFAIALLFLGLVIGSRTSGTSQRHQTNEQEVVISPIGRVEDLKTINHTSAFNIAEIRKVSDAFLEIIFKNEYDKSVTGFEVSIGGMRIQTELILGGDEQQFISPGSTFQKAYDAQSGLDRYGVQVLAVIFDDGSSDGDITAIKEITDYRLGMKTERERVLTLLGHVMMSKSMPMAFEELEAEMSSAIPSSQQNGRLDNVGLGIRNERRRMLQEIRMLKDKHQYAQSDVTKALELKQDLVIITAKCKNIIRLASASSGLKRRSN